MLEKLTIAINSLTIDSLIAITLRNVTILLYLLQFVCTLLIVFYILFQTRVLRKIESGVSIRSIIKETGILIVVFGSLAILATTTGIRIFDTPESPIANVRNLAPFIAGVLGGPLAGIGAGLIGGLHRYFLPRGTETALPCMVATLSAGIIGGILFLIYKKKFLKPLHATLIIAIFEVYDMTLILFLSRTPYPGSVPIVMELFIPMFVANTFGVFIFTFMVNRALNYQNIKDVKDKIEIELKTAHEIQISMLPRIFPAFPDRNEFDIYAIMSPAKNVGGDFYDFFLIDKNRLCFIIGDVSDKGVPAALFMTIIKTLLKTEALRAIAPSEVLKRVNDILYPDNESCSFATVFCGYLNVKTGEIEYSNGGHLPPYVLSQGKNPEGARMDRNYIVGNMREASFTTQNMKLGVGDVLFLYTDGITEAENGEELMYTEKRLVVTLKNSHAHHNNAQDIVKRVLSEVKIFTGDAPQYDDMTIVALQFKGD